MDLHLHIGMPKCGSTTIQEVLGFNRQKLAENGWSYPSSLLHLQEGPNTDLPARWVEGDGSILDACEPLTSGKAKSLILSSEFFYLFLPKCGQDLIRQVGDALHEAGIRLHIYDVYRGAAAYAKSMYKQRVVNRVENHGLFQDAVIKSIQDEHRQEIENLVAALQPVTSHSIKLGPDYLDEFMAAVGHDALDLDIPDEPQNASLEDVYVDILRQFNAMLETCPDRAGPGRGHVAALVLEASQCSSRALVRQRRNVPLDQRVPSMKDLDALKFVPNPPLSYSEEEFERARDRLKAALPKIARQASRRKARILARIAHERGDEQGQSSDPA